MHLIKLSALALLCVALPMGASASVVDFEDLNNNGSSGYTLFGDNINSGGFNFVSTTHTGSDPIASWTVDLPYYTGSCSLFANYGDDYLRMTKIGGGAFDVTSIDAADVFRGVGGQTVNITGTRANATTVTQQIVIQADNLHTYALSGMTNIVSLSLGDGTNSVVQFDNLVVSPVPEPASMAVLSIGALVLLRRRRAR